jgi:hypothetical protein
MKSYLALILIGVSLTFGQEYFQKDLKVIKEPQFTGPEKFQIKYISPDISNSPDSIFQEVGYIFNEENDNWDDLMSIFLWNNNPRSLAFQTSTKALTGNPYYQYNKFDTTPEQKGVFNLVEGLYDHGKVIVYSEGVTRSKGFQNDSAKVLVSIFSLDLNVPLRFNFYEKVTKNTTFKVIAGKVSNSKYLIVEMYQDYIFEKVVYSWISEPVENPTNILKSNNSKFSLSNKRKFDIMGRHKIPLNHNHFERKF